MNIKPTRDMHDDKASFMVADIDAIVVKPVTFKWDNRIHELNPVTTRHFLLVTEAFAKMDSMQNQKNFSTEDLINVYYEVFKSMCNTISREDIYKMTQAQVAAIFQLILDHVTGRIEKKKT